MLPSNQIWFYEAIPNWGKSPTIGIVLELSGVTLYVVQKRRVSHCHSPPKAVVFDLHVIQGILSN